MLHKEAVEKSTFNLLKELMSSKPLMEFSLAGGTALALQLGHIKSDDLDFFLLKDFDKTKMQTDLKKLFKLRIDIHSSVKNPLGVFSHLNHIKIDIEKHPYPLINKVLTEEGIRMWSLVNIAAAKVYAISIRATKKDFWDIDRLLDFINIGEIADAYYKRYNQFVALQFVALGVPKMLTYFSEADETKAPECLMHKTWSRVKKKIAKKLINN